ncbi:hypothetical protein ACFPRL_28630 [Pseudoclavibacter helvolus]
MPCKGDARAGHGGHTGFMQDSRSPVPGPTEAHTPPSIPSRMLPRVPSWVVDALAALFIVGVVVMPFGGEEFRPSTPFAFVMVLAPAVLLPFRRRWPAAVLAAMLAIYGATALRARSPPALSWPPLSPCSAWRRSRPDAGRSSRPPAPSSASHSSACSRRSAASSTRARSSSPSRWPSPPPPPATQHAPDASTSSPSRNAPSEQSGRGRRRPRGRRPSPSLGSNGSMPSWSPSARRGSKST